MAIPPEVRQGDVTLDVIRGEVTLDVVGEVGPRGIQGIQGEQGVQGIQGEIGPVGPEGPAGTSSGFYRHNQPVAATQWNFVHDLNYPPSITVVDSAGTQFFGDVTYVDDFTIQIDFAFPFAGYAFCT
jgi:hypothetical protein